ncbi:5-oxoprolinase subunit B family protein [Nioella nitratireducens]|uniref:5-oxoprolinase subunit B family protein n=1 Tax=Nioella nitratireducens TaxID=1287720 RepID=UPI0008FD70D8|nr:carboxyltransferase domain-containing protein [Nioella nitratireducens]
MSGTDPGAGFPRLHHIGEDGMLVEFGDRLTMAVNGAAIAFRAAVEAAGWPGVAETATSLKSVFLRFDPLDLPHETLRAHLVDLLATCDWYGVGLPRGRRLWTVPTAFGGDEGPKLEEVAALAGMSRAEVIDALCARPVRVLTLGFLPGMPYLGQLGAAFDFPRQTELTPNVPAGGLAVAIRQLVLFPGQTQTGWRWIGRAALDVFGLTADHPFPLSAGDEVRFRPVGASEFAELQDACRAGRMVATEQALS